MKAGLARAGQTHSPLLDLYFQSGSHPELHAAAQTSLELVTLPHQPSKQLGLATVPPDLVQVHFCHLRMVFIHVPVLHVSHAQLMHNPQYSHAHYQGHV